MSKFGVPTDEQLAKINKLAKRPLTAEELFVFSGKSAGDMMIPNRYTRISKELLQVMVDDAKKGVSFMYNHNWGSYGGSLKGVPYGKVFDGELKSSLENDETTELHLSKFIFRDDEVVDGMSANSLIKKIESGVLSDTSISFSTDTMVCSICGMNYYSRDCSHWRGSTYEMSDGTKKQCTLTAMPPSLIIPYNNNALYEESIVWDGAYPGAMVSQAKDGDVIELPTGNFAILGEKEELPDKTIFINKYSNGNILTMVKKSDHKKLFNVAKVEQTADSITITNGVEESTITNEGLTRVNLKGSEVSMDENLKKMLETYGVEFDPETFKEDALLIQLAEAWATIPEVEPQEGQIDMYMTQETVTEKLGTALSADEVLKLAKEGQEYHKSLSDDAISMGVRAMGNDFPKETWEKSFTSMGTNSIKDIMKTWKLQADSAIPAGRYTDPESGQEQKLSIPDDAFKVGK